MKKTQTILAAIALSGALVAAISCNNTPAAPAAGSAEQISAAKKGDIVYFNLDRVLEEYDMANDLRSVVETKVNSINQEVNRRGSKLEKEIKSFQDKMDKGLLTRSTAEIQGQKLQEQQNQFQQYAGQKQQEIAEEQSVMMNQLADAIKNFLEEYNAKMGYAMILTTQGPILPAPVAVGSADLDITDAILEGLNAAYIKDKAAKSDKK